MILAIDTATSNGAIALWDDRLAGVVAWRSDRQQTAELIPAVEAIFRVTGVGWPNLSAIAVAIGPGSFNGIRVGLGTAKAFALARSLPLVPVNTLEAMAWPFRRLGSIAAILPAGRDFAVARYRGSEFHEVRSPAIIPAAELGEATAGAITIGEATVADLGGAVLTVSASERVIAVAEIAALRGQPGAERAEVVEPLYLRRPHITMPRGHQSP